MTLADRLDRAVAPYTAVRGGTTTPGDCRRALGGIVRADSRDQGPAVAAFERELARHVGVDHAVAFGSGRLSFFAILRALGVAAGDEVLVPLPTHVVIANAVRYVGGSAVYVDCRMDTFAIDLRHAQALITPRTRALLVQHTFGIPAALDEAAELCRRHGLELIEDCVHALGSRSGGRPVGSTGRAAFFSTEETKTITTTMGGAAVTSDAALASRLRALQASCAVPPRSLVTSSMTKLILHHALSEPSVHRPMRWLYERLGRRQPLPGAMTEGEADGLRPARYELRLSDAQAAVGVRQLRRLDENVLHRRAIAERYAQRLAGAGLGLPEPTDGAKPAYVRFPVVVPDRARAVRALSPLTVPGLWFTSVLEEATSPAALGYRSGQCPHAERCARELVNLPTHGRVSLRHADRIAGALADAFSDEPGASLRADAWHRRSRGFARA